MPEVLTRDRRQEAVRSGRNGIGTVAGFTSEWWPTSRRNPQVIDFGDVMTGWREYDLLGPSAFMCGGKPGRVRSLFEGYGMAASECSDVMRRRLLTLMLLHRASDLRNVRIDEWESKIESLLDLADVIWNVSER